VFGRARLPDHDGPDRALLRMAAAEAPPDDLFAVDDEAVRWLKGHVDDAIAAWLEGVECVHPGGWIVVGWLETLGFCDYRELENDPGAYASGVYFVNTPAPPELAHVRSDCDPSCVSFYDPRVGFNALAVDGDPYHSQVFHARPEAGTLMIWPGYVRHIVRVHLAREPWVMVRFRVELDLGPVPGA